MASPVVDDRGVCGRYMTCPYHQWSYDLSGQLRRIPQAAQQFPGLDPHDWALHPAAVDVWHGMVFANPDPGAPALHEALGFLADRLDRFLSGPLVEVARVTYTARCNWKLMIENHIDVYHLWFVHDRSLAMYDHRRFEWDLESPNWWSHEPRRDPAGAPAPGLGWITARDREGIGAHLLFPNLMLVTTGAYFGTYDATPVSADTTTLTLRVRSRPDADGKALVDSVRSFMAEDVAVCERLQNVAGASRFSAGPLAATHEAPIREFHRAVAERCRTAGD